MSDIKIQNTPDGFGFDFALANMDLATDDGLETAVLVSVFSDQRVSIEDLAQGETDQKGWWGDEFLPDASDQIGSKLWTIRREKRTADTLAKAKQFIGDCLQWMIEDGVAASVTVFVEWNPDGTLAGVVKIQRPNGKSSDFNFSKNWNSELGITG